MTGRTRKLPLGSTVMQMFDDRKISAEEANILWRKSEPQRVEAFLDNLTARLPSLLEKHIKLVQNGTGVGQELQIPTNLTNILVWYMAFNGSDGVLASNGCRRLVATARRHHVNILIRMLDRNNLCVQVSCGEYFYFMPKYPEAFHIFQCVERRKEERRTCEVERSACAKKT